MQNERKSGIYCIENIITNKKYIEQSIDVDERWRKHISELNHNYHHNDYLQKAWNKYSEDNFKFYVLEYCNINDLDDKEIYYIDLYNTTDRNIGYNLTSGGQFKKGSLSYEVKQKLSNSIKKSYDNTNLREIRRDNALTQWSKPEYREKITGKNNGMYGRHHTEESKRLMSEHSKGIPSHNKNLTPVLCVELNEKFENATDAGKKLSLDSSAILKVCREERKTCGGYHFEFINIGK